MTDNNGQNFDQKSSLELLAPMYLYVPLAKRSGPSFDQT